jgi:hypothetical protein
MNVSDAFGEVALHLFLAGARGLAFAFSGQHQQQQPAAAAAGAAADGFLISSAMMDLASYGLAFSGFLLVGDGLSLALAGTSVGLGTLSANREAFLMTDATIASDFFKPLDVERDFAAKIAFGLVLRNSVRRATSCSSVKFLTRMSSLTFASLQIFARRIGPMP